MIIQEVTDILEELTPLTYAEDFDNVGLLIGDTKTIVSGILVTLDTLENVVDEAIAKDCNLIVSFHPIIFGGLKKLTGSSYVERIVIKAIRHNIAIYSPHTALDNSSEGVNAKICAVLELTDTSILIPKKGTLKKLITYVPKENQNKLKEVLFKAGAGAIGNYSECSFSANGIGSYKAGENTNPTKGKVGQTHYEEETQLNITYPRHKEGSIIKALLKNHPYEEVAYEITTLDNSNPTIGMGMIGNLAKPISEEDFLKLIKKKMNTSCIRHSSLSGKKIRRVAVLGGSGSFAIKYAIAANADIFITADIKYHQFYESEDKIIIADIGHYETEQFTKNLLVEYLTKKIPKFAVYLSESKTNPIEYYH